MNLVEQDILTSPVFSFLPKFQSVVFKTTVGEKVRYFETERDGEKISVLTLMVIRAEEKFFWESCVDLLDRAVQQAAATVAGVYSFELLSFDVHRELKTFSDQELGRLLINHSRKLVPGQTRLIKYSSCFGLLKKLVHEDWGKMVLKTATEIFPKDPVDIDGLVKKTMAVALKQPAPQIIVIHDLSQEPLLVPANQEQKTRLSALFDQQQNLFASQPEVFICDRNGVTDLARKSG